MFWLSVRDVQNGSFVAEPKVGESLYLATAGAAVPKPSNDVGKNEWVKRVMKTFDPPDANGVVRGDLVFFVHGYNNTVKSVAERHDLLQKGLNAAGFPCTVISFDWPSGDVALGYLEDRHDAKQTAMRLVTDGIRLFLAAQRADCEVNIYVLAHSMGAYVVREAFDDADDSTAAFANWNANQIAFIAGDVSAPSFTTGNPATESLMRHCGRLTNYYSLHDEALQVSNLKRAGLSPRVGRVGLPENSISKSVDVDCTARYQALADKDKLKKVNGDKTHSWYFWDQNLMNDLALTFAGKIDRNSFPTRTGSDDSLVLKAK